MNINKPQASSAFVVNLHQLCFHPNVIKIVTEFQQTKMGMELKWLVHREAVHGANSPVGKPEIKRAAVRFQLVEKY